MTFMKHKKLYNYRLTWMLCFFGFCMIGFYYYFLYIPTTLKHYIDLVIMMVTWSVIAIIVSNKAYLRERLQESNGGKKRRTIKITIENIFYGLSVCFLFFMLWYSIQSNVGFLIMLIVAAYSLLVGLVIGRLKEKAQRKTNYLSGISLVLLICLFSFSFVYIGNQMMYQKKADEAFELQGFGVMNVMKKS